MKLPEEINIFNISLFSLQNPICLFFILVSQAKLFHIQNHRAKCGAKLQVLRQKKSESKNFWTPRSEKTLRGKKPLRHTDGIIVLAVCSECFQKEISQPHL